MRVSLHWGLRAPWFDQRVEVQCVGEVQELVTQPADLGAGRQGHGKCRIEHGAAGLWRLIGVTDQVLQLDMVIDEKLAQLVDDVRAVRRADVGDVRQGLWAALERSAAHHVDGEGVFLREVRQASLKARQGVPAARYLEDQRAALAVASKARADHRATVFMTGAAQDVGQLHWVGAKGTDDKELFANCGDGRHAAFLSDERSVHCWLVRRMRRTNDSQLRPGPLPRVACVTKRMRGWSGVCDDENEQSDELRR